jgi:ribosomal-protein-alanine N-acetyltransferase
MVKNNFSPFPALQTKRLSLRKLSLDDAEEIFALRSNDEVNKFIDRAKAKDVDEAIAFINKVNISIANNNSIYWVICYRENPKLIGTICLWNINEKLYKAEVGYELIPEYQGKGIATEALSVVINYGFDEMMLGTIEAYTHKENMASTKLLEKFNFGRNLQEESQLDLTIENLGTLIYSLSKNF